MKPVFIRTMICLAVGMAFSAPLFAQESKPVPTRSDNVGSGAALETIVVTAQKREERVQDVPISVQVISTETIEKLGASHWDALNLPGVKVGNGGLTDNIAIRGVGTGINPGFDQSAPVFIDGAWYGSSRASRIGFLDLERVEILKGPQPTYFGKNSIAGALSMTTRKPGGKFEGYVDTLYEFDAKEKELTGVVNLPVNQSLAFRVAGKWRAMDGWMDNTFLGTRDPEQRDVGGRISMRWEPSDSVSVNVKVDSLESKNIRRETQLVKCVNGSFMGPLEDCQFDLKRSTALDLNSFGSFVRALVGGSRPAEQQTNKVDSAQIGINWDLPSGHSLAATLTSYRNNYFMYTMSGHTYIQGGLRLYQTPDNQTLSSLDVRLDSPRKDRIFWSAGVYTDRTTQNSAGAVEAWGGGDADAWATLTNTTQSGNSWSTFAELGARFTETLTAKVAARYTAQEKSVTGGQTGWDLKGATPAGVPTTAVLVPIGVTSANYGTPVTIATASESMKNTKTTPSVTLEWRPQAQQMYYVNYREGFKAGGFDAFLDNKLNGRAWGFGPETVTYKEAGAKIDFLGGSARVNTALFRADYENLQTAFVVNGVVNTLNAGKSRSQGLEVDGMWAVTEKLRVGASVIFLDAKYVQFANAPCYRVPAQSAAQGCVGGAFGGTQNRAGGKMPFSPEMASTFNVTYQTQTQPFGINGMSSVNFSTTHTDDFFFGADGDPNMVQEANTKFDLRFGHAELKGKWDAGLLIRNLTDKLTAGYMGNVPGAGKFAGTDRPRQIALQFKYKF